LHSSLNRYYFLFFPKVS